MNDQPSTEATKLSPEAIEGQLLAHRQILALLIVAVQRREDGFDLMAELDSLSVMQDHQEDPGAVVDGAVAIQGALANEIQLIVRACSQQEFPTAE